MMATSYLEAGGPRDRPAICEALPETFVAARDTEASSSQCSGP